MKIAMIVRRLNIKGGTQRQALSLANEFLKLEHRVKIYTFFYSKDDCYPDLLEKLEVISLPEKSAPDPKRLALLIDSDIDILNPHDQISYRVAHYYKKCVRLVPSVWNMNDLPGLRWSYDRMRGVDDNFRQPFWKVVYYFIHDWYDNIKFIRSQNAIVTVDDFNRKLVRWYLGREATTVRSGPNFKQFFYKKRSPLGKKFNLLTSGIFFPHRRFEDTIRAVKILSEEGYEPRLSIIGDFQSDLKYYKKLTELVSELRVEDRINFMGKISEDELLNAYHNHDIYVFQHHLQSDGLSPFEAAACGMPIIVSRTAGCHEVLTDHENALFMYPKNPSDIAARIKELAEQPQLYLKLSERGNNFVRDNFSWEKYAQGIMRVIENLSKFKKS
jgi:glycosyltransferase involved in cell wall biosynthesis